jgi:poly(A) polymerase
MADAASRDDQKPAPDASLQEPVVLTKSFHPITADAIDRDALKILHRLHRCGFIAYLCGGAVRDLMLGKTPKDFDIVTDARPGQIKKRFGNAYIIGRRFRLAHVHFEGGKIIEVATFRTADDGRDETPSGPPPGTPEGSYLHLYGTPREDAFRRDFTINGLFYDPFTDSVIDYVGGIEDLALRRIRVIGDAAGRFQDDPVRIWRALRFAARLGFALDPEVERCIPAVLPQLETCSGARLYEELNKDLAYESRPILEAFRRFRVLRHVIGQVGETYENDGLLFERLSGFIEVVDTSKKVGGLWTLHDMYALLFLPWAEACLSAARGDPANILKTAMQSAGIKATLPRLLRADVIQVIILVQAMRRAMGTGRFRWSLKKRIHYDQASRLFFLTEKNRTPTSGEGFENLLREFYPLASNEEGPRRRRRRRRSPPGNPSGSGSQGTSSAH